MKQYIIQIVGAALLAVFADIFAPDDWKKYIGIISGMILLTVIITPAADYKNADILSGYRESEELMTDGNKIYASMLEEEFSKKISEDIERRIAEEFSADTKAEAVLLVNEQGNIEKILQITISGKNLTENIAERISYIYDVDEVKLNEI